MKQLMRVLLTFLVVLLLIFPALAQEEDIVNSGDGFNETAVAVVVLVAFGVGLFGGIGGLLGVLNWLTANEKIMTILEKRYDASSNGTKDIVRTLDKALDVIAAVSKGVLPKIVFEALEKADDFIEEASDGVPKASKPHPADDEPFASAGNPG
jgi:hypothetical protein